jgi:CBS domain containing-hemolysin-like protein
MTADIVLTVILLGLSAFFSAAETSLVGASPIKIRSLAEEGNRRAQTCLKLFEQESKMLSAILICNNLVNTYLASIAAGIAMKFGGGYAVSIATFIITFLILVFGEITPKNLATLHAEKLALFYAPIILFLTRVLTPVIWFIHLFSKGILRLFGVKEGNPAPTMTERELRTIVDVSHEEGVIEEEEKEMINNVFDFGDVLAKEVMVPRIHTVMADVNSTEAELLALFRKEQFTRIPIYDKNPDHLLGIVNMKDMLLRMPGEPFNLRKMIRQPHYTVENKKISDLLVEMQENATNLAFVMDEYGELAGIVTIEDIIEEIVGEVHDEYDVMEAEKIRRLDAHTAIIKGYVSLHDVNDELDLDLDSEDFDSIGGLLIDALGRLPKVGDQAVLDGGIILQATQIQKNRIEEVRLILP